MLQLDLYKSLFFPPRLTGSMPSFMEGKGCYRESARLKEGERTTCCLVPSCLAVADCITYHRSLPQQQQLVPVSSFVLYTHNLPHGDPLETPAAAGQHPLPGPLSVGTSCEFQRHQHQPDGTPPSEVRVSALHVPFPNLQVLVTSSICSPRPKNVNCFLKLLSL